MHEQENKKPKLPPRDELRPADVGRRQVAESNPYRNLKIYHDVDPTFGPVEFYEHLPVVTIPNHPNDRIHTVKMHQENRLDLISWEYYGSVLWWWVIFISQDPPLEDPIKDIVSGRLLRIPYLPNVLLRMV